MTGIGMPSSSVAPPTTARLAGWAAAAAVASLLLSVAVGSQSVSVWELEVVSSAVDTPNLVGYPARAVMELGTLTVVPAVAILVYAICRRWRVTLQVPAAAICAWAVANGVKVLVERPRPLGVRQRETASGWGYPSTHTAVAFALATVVAPLFPRAWRWLPYALAAVVGWARMHVGVHYPFDVVGGASIGLAAGLATRSLSAGLTPRR